MPRPGFLVLARIVSVRGLGGEVRAIRLADPADVFRDLQGVWLQASGDVRELREVERVRASPGQVVLKFRGIDSAEAARRLVGREVCIRREEAPSLPEGTYYHYDIIGLQVVDETGEPLGAIVDVQPTGANDVYVVRGPRGEWLLPAIREIITGVDLDAGQIRIVRREGLLEPEAV